MTRAGVSVRSGGFTLREIVAGTGILFVAGLRRGGAEVVTFTVIAGHGVDPAGRGTDGPALRRRGVLLRRQREERARINKGAVLEARDHARPGVFRALGDVDGLGPGGGLQRASRKARQ